MKNFIGGLVFLLATAASAHANIIGTNSPAMPLTPERVAGRPAWEDYLKHSRRQLQADQDFLRGELRTNRLTTAIMPPRSAAPTGTPLDRAANWYAGAEALRIAQNVASFQTPAGGWSKHTDFTQHRRGPGELFVGDNNSRFIIKDDFDEPAELHWSYVGTFDNGATVTELRFLAKVISAQPDAGAGLKKPFARGLDYLFAAQFPNGGWPQVWPLQGGYHDAVTFNDNAMLNVMRLLRDVAPGEKEFAFVPPELRAKADASWRRGLDCILAAQVVVNGQRKVWGQQHDSLTLQPVAARNYEMPSLASAESAGILQFLMQLPAPDSNIVAAVRAGMEWFEKTKIMDKAFKSSGSAGRNLVDAPGSGPLWARYYQVGTDEPIFGDRDKSIHDDVNEISKERRKGYAWFGDSPKNALKQYVKWAAQNPAQ